MTMELASSSETRNHDAPSDPGQGTGDIDTQPTTSVEEPPYSPSKRLRQDSETPLSPSKRSRNGGESTERGSMELDEQTSFSSGFKRRPAQRLHDRLIDTFIENVLEEFRNKTAEDVCKASPDLPSRSPKTSSISCSLGAHYLEGVSWVDLASKPDKDAGIPMRAILLARRAELASAVLVLLQPDFDKLDSLHRHCLQLFGSRLCAQPAWLLHILHDIKVQLCLIDLDADSERAKDDVLETYFPSNVEQCLRGHAYNERHLSTAETQYISRYGRTRESLANMHDSGQLMERYPWSDFLQNLVNHTRIEVACVIAQHEDSLNREMLAMAEKDHEQLHQQRGQPNAEIAEGFTEDDLLTRAVLEAHAQERAHQFLGAGISTSEQLAKGRIVASSKPSQRLRDARANQSNRKLWSTEEEEALLKGLDDVKGPYWSQILALYGENGTKSTILRDRNQVQLKDKARNLKLFFLKTNQTVPPILAKVTGDLKSRAPMYLPTDDLPDGHHADSPPTPVESHHKLSDNSNVHESSASTNIDMVGTAAVANQSASPSPIQEIQYPQHQEMPDVEEEEVDDPMDEAIRQAVAAVQKAEQNTVRA